MWSEVINQDVHLTERSDLWYGVIQYTGATTHSDAGVPSTAGDIDNIGGSMQRIAQDIRPQPAEGIGVAIGKDGARLMQMASREASTMATQFCKVHREATAWMHKRDGIGGAISQEGIGGA